MNNRITFAENVMFKWSQNRRKSADASNEELLSVHVSTTGGRRLATDHPSIGETTWRRLVGHVKNLERARV